MAHTTNTKYQHNTQYTQRPPKIEQRNKRYELSQPPTNQQPHHNTNKLLLPQPIPWQSLHNLKQEIYTDGSLKKGQPRIGAAVIHSPANTTTYIDAPGQDETHTIMRAELVAIQVALNTYKDDPWVGIFTYSQTSLQAIQNELQRPSHTAYHHKPLITAIFTSLQYRISLGLPTILRKIR